jgi:DNA-3-methyladenine glycosylase
MRRLRRSELPEETVELARFLIGTILVRDEPEARLSARIVETEAYVPGDAASHAFRGETPRNRAMFLKRGHAYVYLIYGTAHCLNVTSERPGIGAAVLIRAAEPLTGLEIMQRRRNTTNPRDLCRGPGRLAQAFALDRTHDKLDLCERGATLWLAANERVTRSSAAGVPLRAHIGESTRIGITKEASRVLRFFERNSRFASGPRALNYYSPTAKPKASAKSRPSTRTARR